MSQKLATLQAALETVLGDKIKRLVLDRGEITITVSAADYEGVARTLRDDASLKFEQLIDLCGIDFSEYKGGVHEGPRYAVVSHLLSVSKNWRLRIKVFATDDDFPVVAAVTPLWTAANWFERETYDLYGIWFSDHPDLRRILTDYGFEGHPLRKSYPYQKRQPLVPERDPLAEPWPQRKGGQKP